MTAAKFSVRHQSSCGRFAHAVLGAHPLRCSLPLCLTLRLSPWLLAAAAPATASADPMTTLDASAPIERQLAPEERHTYRIRSERGQLVRVVVEQQGIDVVVSLRGPGGQRLARVNSPNGSF